MERVEPALVPQRKLSNGMVIPGIGMGTFGNDRFSPEQTAEAVYGAIKAGYRLFDCAAAYGNEKDIGKVFGQAFSKGIVQREELTIMTIDTLLAERPEDAERMVEALRDNFEHDPEMRQYLMKAKKYGNNIASVDKDAAEIAGKVSDMVCSKKNYLGNAFRADWASPSTHLLYGYWVGATPDGRLAREELGYGIDPLYGEAHQGLGFRIMSNMKLPFDKMNGGCASHLGINPNYFKSETMEGKGMEFKDKIMAPLFFNPKKTDGISPFYLYVNVTTPEMLRKVLANPKKYAPSGVYIMRIHGTFVNFLDLSPDIQEDIIKRLDMESTSM